PDPELRASFLNGDVIKESELCIAHHARYILLEPDLVPPSRVPALQPQVLAPFFKLFDDPNNYPILLHCKAGLHRTGVLVAVYRIEYEGWSAAAALRELTDNGFGEDAATAANDYIKQYILTYRPRERRGTFLGAALP